MRTYPTRNKRTQKFGDYEAVEGKLDRQDARSAYVTKTLSDGRRAPIASFWNYEEAVRYAREHSGEAP